MNKKLRAALYTLLVVILVSFVGFLMFDNNILILIRIILVAITIAFVCLAIYELYKYVYNLLK
jgi:hypothetical protein